MVSGVDVPEPEVPDEPEVDPDEEEPDEDPDDAPEDEPTDEDPDDDPEDPPEDEPTDDAPEDAPTDDDPEDAPADDDPFAEVVKRCDWAEIAINTARNSASAIVTTHRRIVRTRRRCALMRWPGSGTPSARAWRRVARGAPGTGKAEESGALIVTSSMSNRWGFGESIGPPRQPGVRTR